MKTLGERLEKILRWLDINQSEAGVRTGISKATISHLIRNRVETYKNSSVIADGLKVNHDWLVYGRGGILNPTVYYLPMIHEYFRLRLFHSEGFLEDNTNFIVNERDYGEGTFATALNGELLICSQFEGDVLPSSTLNFLIWTERRKAIVDEFLPGKRSFIIHELRKYDTLPEFMTES
ncbi:helix-turn-helix transcriptional regulator [Serratia fonticola]|uniref:helix-turn-helix domain-containing protein n=1 Tax=Serratia fonticola TaxID=47917 RepID=UPI001AE2D502|nr:helix-turn-helix transcriptional regulator [Serratia fonticola]MBP1038939.1 helix-turn-helix transcriptional regulator [Serratia fonticola]